MRIFSLMSLFFLIGSNLAHGYSSSAKKKNIVFIVNPISHEIKNQNIEKIIGQNLDPKKFNFTIAYTKSPSHATVLAKEAQKTADIIAAVGGDGTVNEVGAALIHSDTALAIIPVGSGNGLARHLGIPVGLSEGIRALNHAHPTVIDTARINDTVFLNVAGLGFDAHIAEKFAHYGKRGLASYSQLTLQEFQKYEPQNYLIHIEGKPFVKKAFILAFANSSQYGNDFYISPKASIDDGYLDLIIIDTVPPHYVPQFLHRFKQSTLDKSRHFEAHKFKKLTIQHPYMLIHIDGEPREFHDSVTITVDPQSLKVIVPN